MHFFIASTITQTSDHEKDNNNYFSNKCELNTFYVTFVTQKPLINDLKLIL